MLIQLQTQVWCGRREQKCTCGLSVCGNCSKCGTFWRFYPKGDGLGLRKQLVPYVFGNRAEQTAQKGC